MTFAITAPGPGELIVILLIFVLLFGAKKLPELGSSIGQGLKNFKKGVDDGKDEDQPERADDAERPGAASSDAERTTPASRDPQ